MLLKIEYIINGLDEKQIYYIRIKYCVSTISIRHIVDNAKKVEKNFITCDFFSLPAHKDIKIALDRA
jgi:hypothetical protein